MNYLSKQDLLKEIIEDIKNEISDEEVIHLILNRKVAVKENKKENTLGQKAADRVAKIAGSWRFVFVFICVLAVWIFVNRIIGKNAIDPFPFVLLNLVLSCLAAIQAPLIMMSQNRQDEKDRQRAENDYRVNLKTEIIIQELYDKLDIVIESQTKPSSFDG